MADFKQSDPSSLYGPQLVGAKVRELLKGKYEVIPKTKEHIKVDRDRCVRHGLPVVLHHLPHRVL